MSFVFFREESKTESDAEEPWIMTVKGLHSLEGLAAHPAPQKVQNGSAAAHAKDTNLNFFRDKVVPVSGDNYDSNFSLTFE